MTTCANCGYASQESFAFCPECGTKRTAVLPTDPLIGRTLNGKYRVVSEIGSGAMGTVYEGEHIGLKKQVALKILHANIQIGEETRQRFQREGIAAGRFTHPNAIQIFDFDEDEGPVFYLAMEFVNGLDLKRLIKEEGAMPVERVVYIASRILGALAEAHRHGIVHRDLKPENVMVVRDAQGGIRSVKVLDFGLSKLIDRQVDASLTEAGRVMGTPLYMSPEQVSGDAVDLRTDLYSVGLTIYEMLSGKATFRGATLQEILGKQLKELPEPLTQSDPDLKVPAGLDDFLAKALEKDRADRFQTADEMLEALKAAAGGQRTGHASRPTPQTSGASSGRPSSRRWFGMVIVVLVLLGAALGVFVLFGGAPSAGDEQARVRSKPAELRSPAEAAYVQRLDSVRSDLLENSTESASSKIREALRAEVADAEAYFLRGLVFRQEKDDDMARVDLEEALQLDPNYGDAAAELGWMELDQGHIQRARDRFLEAARIDPNCAEAIAGQGAVSLLEGDIDTAKTLLDQAIELDANMVRGNLFLGQAHLADGDPDEAVTAFVRAKRSAPGAWEAFVGLGQAYAQLERWQDARTQLEGAVGVAPDSAEAQLALGGLLVQREQFTQAVTRLTKAAELAPRDADVRLMLGIALAETDFADGAIAQLSKALELGAEDARAQALLGTLHGAEGRFEEALVHYDAALALDEELAAIHANRGAALIALERYEEALAPLKRSVELDSEAAYPHLCLGLLYMEFLGDPDLARSHLRKYGKLGGEDPRPAQWLRGRVR